MKRFQMGLAGVAALAVIAGAMAARMDWPLQEFRASSAARTGATPSTAAASAAAGTRANGAQPLVPGGYFTLVGEVVGLASANEPLIVSARVGNQLFPATIQGNTFTVMVSGGPANAMVTLRADSTRVHYESVAGSFGMLDTLAGSDQKLLVSEHPALRVSPYTTAVRLLGRFALSGREPTSDNEFERATRAIWTDDLDGAAYILGNAATGQFPLPSGFADGYQVVDDRAAFREFMTEGGDFQQSTLGYLFNNAAAVPLQSLSELPERLVMTSALSATNLPMSGTAQMLQRDAQNRYWLYEDVGINKPQYNASIGTDGSVVLLPVLERGSVYFSEVDNINFRRVRVRVEMRRLSRGQMFSQWAVKTDVDDYGLNSGLFYARTFYNVYNAVDLQRWMLPQDWGNLMGRTLLLPRPCEDVLSQLIRCHSARHQFTLDGADQQIGWLLGEGYKFGQQMSLLDDNRGFPATGWQVDSQARTLRISGTNGATTFWRVEGEDKGAGTVFYFVDDSLDTGQQRVGIDFVVPQSRPSENMLTADGSWKRGDFTSRPPHYQRFDDSYDVVRSSPTAMHRRIRDAPNGAWLAWKTYLSQGVLVDSRADVPEPMTSCEESAWRPCVTQATYFRPLMRVGQRFYGLQEEYRYDDLGNGSYSLTRVASLPMYQDCAGGACLQATGMTDEAASGMATAPARSLSWRPVMGDRPLFERRPVLRSGPPQR